MNKILARFKALLVCLPGFLVFAASAPSLAQQDGEPAANYSVILETTKGPCRIMLYEKATPITVSNFLNLVKKEFYDGTVFHRYEEGFVIQGGSRNGPNGVYVNPKTGKPRRIPLEKPLNVKHDKPGVVGMARVEDPDSASCQFYITLLERPELDNAPGYAAFGYVSRGMENVQKLRIGDRITKAYVEVGPSKRLENSGTAPAPGSEADENQKDQAPKTEPKKPI